MEQDFFAFGLSFGHFIQFAFPAYFALLAWATVRFSHKLLFYPFNKFGFKYFYYQGVIPASTDNIAKSASKAFGNIILRDENLLGMNKSFQKKLRFRLRVSAFKFIDYIESIYNSTSHIYRSKKSGRLEYNKTMNALASIQVSVFRQLNTHLEDAYNLKGAIRKALSGKAGRNLSYKIEEYTDESLRKLAAFMILPGLLSGLYFSFFWIHSAIPWIFPLVSMIFAYVISLFSIFILAFPVSAFSFFKIKIQGPFLKEQKKWAELYSTQTAKQIIDRRLFVRYLIEGENRARLKNLIRDPVESIWMEKLSPLYPLLPEEKSEAMTKLIEIVTDELITLLLEHKEIINSNLEKNINLKKYIKNKILSLSPSNLADFIVRAWMPNLSGLVLLAGLQGAGFGLLLVLLFSQVAG